MSVRMIACTLSMIVALGVPSASIADDAALPITVPMKYVHGEIVVAVRVNGQGPFSFLLDTDTNPSIIDAGLARRLHIRSEGPGGVGDGIGTERHVAVPVVLQHVTLGALHVNALSALSLDLAHVSEHFGHRIDGVLGVSFFTDRVVQIDYHCGTVAILPDAILAPFTARFENADNNISHDVFVGGHRATATFDTGDNGEAFIPGNGIAHLGLSAAARKGKSAKSYGFNGLDRETSGVAPDVRIGRISVGTLPVRFAPAARDAYDINIGNRVLERFIVTFDYQRGLLTLAPQQRCSARS